GYLGGCVAVRPQELVQIARAYWPGDMIDHLGILAPLRERCGVVQVSADHAHVAPSMRLRLRRVADQTGHLVAPCPQGLHAMRTDEPRPAGDERLHRDLS